MSENIEDVSISSDGLITVTFSTKVPSAGGGQASLTFQPYTEDGAGAKTDVNASNANGNKVLRWRCESALEQKFLPKRCKSSS